MALATPLQTKVAQPDQALLVAHFPALYKRATLVEPIIRGRRVLWVDDHPSNNFYERLALAQMGVSIDVATSTDEGLRSATLLRPDVVVSDMVTSSGRVSSGSLRAMVKTMPVCNY